MKKKFLKTVFILAAALAVVLIFSTFAFAESSEIKFTKKLSGNTVTITSDTPIEALYLRFAEEPGEWTLSSESGSFAAGKNAFLHEYIDIKAAFGGGQAKLTMEFPSGNKPKEIYAFDGTDVPNWVQIWQPPCETADFMLISTHADDEQLFFAGVLPYYSQVKCYAVQVVYATDHTVASGRHSERLDGLWTVGIRNYPVSMHLPDAYSESVEGALKNLKSAGIDQNEVARRMAEVIERFKPQVIATHDINGEYGHGQHMLITNTLQKILDEELLKEGPDWSFLKKVYLHLYGENKVVLGFMDQAFDELGGLTPFQLTQKGFQCHKSQLWTWFNKWINGSNGSITKASQVKTYNPALYGMYFGDASADTEKNDFFENVSSYEEQRIEAQRKAEEEAKRKAEEEAAKKAEEQRLLEEEQKRQEAERLAKEASKKKIMSAVVLISAIIMGVAVFVLFNGKKGKHSKK